MHYFSILPAVYFAKRRWPQSRRSKRSLSSTTSRRCRGNHIADIITKNRKDVKKAWALNKYQDLRMWRYASLILILSFNILAFFVYHYEQKLPFKDHDYFHRHSFKVRPQYYEPLWRLAIGSTVACILFLATMIFKGAAISFGDFAPREMVHKGAAIIFGELTPRKFWDYDYVLNGLTGDTEKEKVPRQVLCEEAPRFPHRRRANRRPFRALGLIMALVSPITVSPYIGGTVPPSPQPHTNDTQHHTHMHTHDQTHKHACTAYHGSCAILCRPQDPFRVVATLSTQNVPIWPPSKSSGTVLGVQGPPNAPQKATRDFVTIVTKSWEVNWRAFGAH